MQQFFLMELVEFGLDAVASKPLRQCEHAVTMLAAVVAVADEDAGLSVGAWVLMNSRRDEY
jgi:hypothetical protein